MSKSLHIFLLLFPVISFAGNITGNVFDIETNAPLEGVNIIIKELQLGSITNNRGDFYIDDITSGKYTVVISYLGYSSKTKEVSVNNNSAALKIGLQKKKMQLDEVVVTSNKYAELKKVPLRIDLIQVEQIEDSPEHRITDILGNVSGINVENTLGVYSSRSTVSLRGISGDDQSRTLILMDNISLNKSDGGSVNWNMINKENIDAIKIIKGCGPAKYGSNAMGGVINIITKKPGKKIGGFIKGGYGSYNTFSGNTSLSGLSKLNNKNKFYWNILGSVLKSDGYITELEEYTETADSLFEPVFLEEINASTKLGYIYKDKHNIEVFANYFNDIRGSGIKVFDEYGAYSEHDTWFSALKYNYKYKKLNINSKAFYLAEDYQRVYEDYREGEYKLYEVDSKRKENGADIDLSYTQKKHNTSVGFAYKQGSVNAVDSYITSTDEISNSGKMDIAAVYIQDEIDFSKYNIQINIGLRYDYAKFSDANYTVSNHSYALEYLSKFQDTLISPKYWDAISPRLSIQKRFNQDTRIYFSYGNGFKAPLLDDLCRTSRKRGSVKVANPLLKPETVNNLEIGVDYSLGKKLKVKQSVYYTIGNDFMYLISTGDSVNMGYKKAPVYTLDNISKVKIYGIENDIEFRINSSLSAFLNYTYNISQIIEHETNNDESDDNLSNKYLTNIPNHKLAAGLNWKNKIAHTSISAKYIGSRWINDLNEVDDEYLMTDKFSAYTLFNAKFQRELFKDFTAMLSVNNIFNTIYVNSKYQRCPGRTIAIEAIYKF